VLYNNWLSDVAQRFQQRFERIQAHYNFDFGDEFEVAICEVLRDILPRRFGVCRGFVVGRNGERAGDDIIIFDAGRSPTIRALATDLSRKEDVPAEAVLAYIEAKHTLAIAGDVSDGQSLAKATHQIEQMKAIPRPPVELASIIPGVRLNGIGLRPPQGFPNICNPYYTAIWGRHIRADDVNPFEAFTSRLNEVGGRRMELPDAIAAGTLLALPVVRAVDGTVAIKPFICHETELGSIANVISPWGIAFAHLLWAIEWIRLGELPWSAMLSEQFSAPTISLATPPLRGTKFEPSS